MKRISPPFLALLIVVMLLGCAANSVADSGNSVISSVSPSQVVAGGAGFNLAVYGSGFVGNAVVLWNGSARATQFISKTQLQASISSIDIQLAGSAQVTVSDQRGNAVPSNPAFVTIQGSLPLGVMTSSLPAGEIAGSYSATLTAKGGSPPYKWGVASGSLPPGLLLSSSTGAVTGTPTGSGQYSFTVQVQDSQASPQTATGALGISVASPLQIKTTSLPSGQVQTSYQTTVAAAGGITPYSWSVILGSLPPGLALSASTGTIIGTPTASGQYSFTLQAQDSAASTQIAISTFNISIAAAAAAAPQITTSALPNGTVQLAYSATLAATGGTPPYSWSVVSGSLPSGLALGVSTGAVTGTPTASGQYSFTLQVKDSATSPQTASKQFGISVGTSALQITTSTLPNGILQVAYSATLAARGGTTPYSWSIVSGQLPPGLALTASTGQITGLATTAGQYAFTVQIKDASATSATVTQALTLTVGNTVARDLYGGRTDIPCAQASGWFHTEKINTRWWLCTPTGNAFFFQGVYGSAFGDANYNAKWQSKYPTPAAWEDATDNELLGWGFNGIGQESNGDVTPYGTSGSVMMPFLFMERPAYYSMENPVMQTTTGNRRLLSDPVKNMLYSQSPLYSGYTPGNGVADYYDAKMDTWLKTDLVTDQYIVGLLASPKLNYLVGINSDDGDEMWGFGVGPEFALPGHTNVNLGLATAAMSPVQTANSSWGWVYVDTVIHSKTAWHDYLVAEYGTINALNSAWGSTYTTFDSSGTVVTGEPIGSGNGATATFSHTVNKLTPSRYSVQVLVAGVPVAGDIGNGNLWGPNSSGTVNYSTGALLITFSTAPAVGAAITVNYQANGWEIGTGLMDEDNRPTHQAWLGSDWTALSNANGTAAADMNGFLFQIASKYFKICHDDLKATFPNVLFLGPDTLITFGVPSSAPVLRAATLYMDAFVAGSGQSQFTQPMIDFVYQNWGDKPYITTSFKSANADSALSAFSDAGTNGYLTQSSRGQAYYNNMASLLSATVTATGSHPYIGMQWWDYLDNWGEKINWGLKTDNDNAYDGHEAVQAIVACSAPLQMYTCGGEHANYGDVITPVKAANLLWLTIQP